MFQPIIQDWDEEEEPHVAIFIGEMQDDTDSDFDLEPGVEEGDDLELGLEPPLEFSFGADPHHFE